MLKKNLISFEPTTFSQKLTLYLPKTNSQSNQFFFELAATFTKWTQNRYPQILANPELSFNPACAGANIDLVFFSLSAVTDFLRTSLFTFRNNDQISVSPILL